MTEAERHAAEVEGWRRARYARLTREDGWLALSGILWLEAGDNATPAGVVTLDRGRILFRAAPGERVTHDGREVGEIELRSDAGGAAPTVLSWGSKRLHVIDRVGRLALRETDAASAARAAFAGIASFPVDLAWRVPARLQPAPDGHVLAMPTILGVPERIPSPGKLAFEAGGARLALDALREPGTSDLFIVFGDATNGRETYGGGRFLRAPLADASGATVLDFNRAYNPPCVFTPFATCPLPSHENRLPIAVTAGEKSWP